jgi:hypothetical protein
MTRVQGAAGREAPHDAIIVVGAGRSGTTMLREVLGQHPDVACCEFELNYLWRHGHATLAHDCLTPAEHLTPAIARRIRAGLERQRRRRNRPRLLDKTVANVMRLGYVHAVLPDARIVHIIRDGRAVVASAVKRWQASESARYYAAKMQTVPWRDVPIYAVQFASRALQARLRRRKHRQSWGPRFAGIDEAVDRHPLARVCAMQWRYSVEAALAQRALLPPDQYLEVRYETLLADPVAGVERITKFLQLEPASAIDEWIAARIAPHRPPEWRSQLDEDAWRAVTQEIGPLLAELGYR